MRTTISDGNRKLLANEVQFAALVVAIEEIDWSDGVCEIDVTITKAVDSSIKTLILTFFPMGKSFTGAIADFTKTKIEKICEEVSKNRKT